MTSLPIRTLEDPEDQEVLDLWLRERQYLIRLFTKSSAPPITNVQEFQNSMFEHCTYLISNIDATLQIVNEQIQEILAIHINQIFDIKRRSYHRKNKFLAVEYNRYVLKQNQLQVSLINVIMNDLQSLFRLSILFPSINTIMQSDPLVVDFLVGDLSTYYRETEKQTYDKKVAKLHITSRAFTASSIAVEQKPIFSWPLIENEDGYEIFSHHLDNSELTAYPIIQDMITNFSTMDLKQFSKTLDQAVHAIITDFSMSESSSKVVICFVVDKIFRTIFLTNPSLIKLNLTDMNFSQEDGEVTLKDSKIPSWIITHEDESTTIRDFVYNNPTLATAAGEMFCCCFEYSPLSVLRRVDSACNKVQEYITQQMRDQGKESAFVPFDDVFPVFYAVLSVSDIPNLASLINLACNYLTEKQLTNSLQFAQLSLSSAATIPRIHH